MPRITDILMMVVLLVVTMVMLTMMQNVSHTMVASLQESSSWNETPQVVVIPAPAPKAVPDIDWAGNTLKIAPFAFLGALLIVYFFRRSPNTRQTEHGIDRSLQESIRTRNQELEMTSLGDLAPEQPTSTSSNTPKEITEPAPRSRWESLE